MNVSSRLLKNLSRFRLVTFDVTDTLLKFQEPPALQYKKTAHKFGYNISSEEINNIFKTEFKHMFRHYPNFGRHGNIKWKEWWRKLIYNVFLATETNIPQEDLDKIADELIKVYRTETGECWVKTSGADDIVNKVKMLNKKIGIISNSDPSLHDVIKFMKFPKFDFILTSHEFGIMKPKIEIFEKALELSGNRPESDEALHIGNSIELDYFGALKAGWSSLLILDPNDKKTITSIQNNTNINKNHVFTSLQDVLGKLESIDFKW